MVLLTMCGGALVPAAALHGLVALLHSMVLLPSVRVCSTSPLHSGCSAGAVDVAYMDRLDYVSMLCNELVYTQCVEAWLVLLLLGHATPGDADSME